MKIRKIAAAAVIAAVMAAASVTAVFAAVRFDGTARAYWGQGVGQARWEAVENAKKYEVRLYENDERIKTITVGSRQADLSPYMSDNNSYTFEVRAIPTDSQRSKYSSGDWVMCEDGQVATGRGDVDGRFREYQNGRKYEREEAGYVVNQWYLIQGNWYYFDAEGYILTGWQQINGKWYYLGTDGVMQTGWQQLDGSWYYLQADGSMAVGWLETAPGQWYYLDADGKMLADTEVEGHRLNASGLRIS